MEWTLTTYALNLTGIVSVNISGMVSGVGHCLAGNIVYDATAVPEPGSIT